MDGETVEEKRGRVVGYDLARAFALFGMVVVNFKIVMGAEDSGPEWLASLLGLLDGRAAATFVVLAGVGVSLLSAGARESGDLAAQQGNRNLLLRRALFLFVVGLSYTPLWPADILHFYGIYIACAAFLLLTSTRRLMGIAVGLVVLFVVLLLTLNYELGWDWGTLSYEGMWTLHGMLRHLFFNGFHPVVPWLAFLLIGMVVGRLDLTVAAVRNRVLRWSILGVLVGEGGSWALSRVVHGAGLMPQEEGDLLAILGTGPMPPAPFYMLAGSATAVTVIVICVAIGARYRDAGWMTPLVATGQLALTLYVAHVVLGMGVLEVAGALENQTLSFSLASAVVFCFASVLSAAAWRSRFRRGPLEWVMRMASGSRI